MKLKTLLENIRQYQIDEVIMNIRNNTLFYNEMNLRGPSVFESGMCYEFAQALYRSLKKHNEKPELIFLIGSMKEKDAQFYDTDEFDPRTEHPFHTIVKVRKFYYDINGRLGTKRDILAMWYKFKKKKLISINEHELLPFIKHRKVSKHLEEIFDNEIEGIK